MGNHKKQCLDSVVGVPTTPKADPAIATTPIGDSSGTSGTGGGAVPPVAAKPAAFEPFDFLTARFGLGVPYSSSSSTVAMTPVPSVLAVVKGDSSSSQPTAEPQQQQKKPGVNAQAKRARQVRKESGKEGQRPGLVVEHSSKQFGDYILRRRASPASVHTGVSGR